MDLLTHKVSLEELAFFWPHDLEFSHLGLHLTAEQVEVNFGICMPGDEYDRRDIHLLFTGVKDFQLTTISLPKLEGDLEGYNAELVVSPDSLPRILFSFNLMHGEPPKMEFTFEDCYTDTPDWLENIKSFWSDLDQKANEAEG